MNQPSISTPSYSQRRIGTLQALSAPLGLSITELNSLANRAGGLYRLVPITKPDGSIRNTYDARTPLKAVHARIKTQILDHVLYPDYLTGSLKGCDYKVNAARHAGAKIVISEDISGFFPSTTAGSVFRVWHNLLGFIKEVAQCLTQLTTLDGVLPQGAITSPFLANLVFWQDEPTLYSGLTSQGLIYTRYVDDIAVSSATVLTNDEKSDVISRVYGMLLKNGYQPKRSKHEISTSGSRMEVTKLAVNTKPGLGKTTYSNTRAAVHDMEKRVANGEILSFERGSYTKAMGRVCHLARFHPGKAASLKQRLLALKEGS